MKDKEREIIERKEEIAELKASIEKHLATIESLKANIVEHEQHQLQMQLRIDSLTVRALIMTQFPFTCAPGVMDFFDLGYQFQLV